MAQAGLAIRKAQWHQRGCVVLAPLLPAATIGAHIVAASDILQEISDRPQLDVRRVVEEGRAVDGVLGLEAVRVGTVVDDYGLRDVAAQQGQVLHVVTVVEDAVLSEQPPADQLRRVEDVEQRVGVLAERRCVDDQLIVLGKPLQELVHPWPFHHEDLVCDAIDDHRDGEGGAFHGLEGRVHERFVQIQRQALLGTV